MPGVHFIPPQGITESDLIPPNLRHAHFIPTQGYQGVGGISPGPPIPSNWFNVNWKRRILFTVNPDQVPSTQTDFATLINFIIPDLIGNVQVNGEDIRLVLPDKTELDHEVIKIDDVTGELIVWFQMPTIQDASTVYLYYDNPGAVAPPITTAQNVWDSDYQSVLHANKLVPISAPHSAIDSTINQKDAVATLVNITTDGKIGDALSFVAGGSADGLEQADIPTPTGGTITVSLWLKYSDFSQGAYIIMKDPANLRWSLFLQNDFLRWRGGGFGTTLQTPSSTDNEYHYLVITQTGQDSKMYLDGMEVATNPGLDQIIADTKPVRYGRFEGTGNVFDYNGFMQAMRISKIIRSADMIKVEFNNQNAPIIFWAQSSPEIITGFQFILFEDGFTMINFEGGVENILFENVNP